MSALAAVLTTFFDVADRAYLPTVVGRPDLVRANGALAATSSAMEFAAFGVAGFLVNLLTAPIAIAIDAVSFLVSAVLLGSIRRPGAAAAARGRARARDRTRSARACAWSSTTRSCAGSPGARWAWRRCGACSARRGCCS